MQRKLDRFIRRQTTNQSSTNASLYPFLNGKKATRCSEQTSCCCMMMTRGLLPSRLGQNESASDMQTEARPPFVTLVVPNNRLFSSTALDRLHSIVKLFGSMVWCCMSSPEVKQVQLAAAHSEAINTSLIDDAVRIVLQHLPDVAAVYPVSLVCRSAVAARLLKVTVHRHIKRLEQKFLIDFQQVEELLQRACVRL